QRVADNPGYGFDSHGVFVYDSHADRCLLLSKKGGPHSGEAWKISAYSIASDKWEVVDIKGDPLPQDTPGRDWEAAQYAGYYDAGQNVFVLYNGRNATTYAYRHQAR
ncbi:MAG: hypothetical protein JNJ60_01810, partial [Rhodocyclaceae bacterium]|nr:hypothetical protein [Rhodocyclaceae bacterium]